MLRLMTENALQSGTNPVAIINEVAAVTRRLIEGFIERCSSRDRRAAQRVYFDAPLYFFKVGIVLMSACGRYCCKSLFALVIKNSPGCRRDFRVKMWGTSSPEDKLTGDLGNVIETTYT
jgi:hypothetical protein